MGARPVHQVPHVGEVVAEAVDVRLDALVKDEEEYLIRVRVRGRVRVRVRVRIRIRVRVSQG